jgi:hypothetical protein
LKRVVTTASGDSSVLIPSYLVRYAIVYPSGNDNADTTKIQLVDDIKHGSLVDTTDASGVAGRSLRITPFTVPFTDSVVVSAAATFPSGRPVPGSPIRFVVPVKIQ